MGRRFLLVGLSLFGALDVAQAQGPGRVVGRVTSAEGNRPVAGATVLLVGTAVGTLTDTAGRFTLANVPAGNRRIQARRLGFVSASQTVSVTGGQAATVEFSLVTSPIQLEEIRTTGYGTQEARTVTGAVATVSAEKIKDIPTSDPMKAIQ